MNSSTPREAEGAVVVTGATRGIGLATARAVARRGFGVVLLCRDATRGGEVLAALPGPGEHRVVVADLASLAAVRRAAHQVLTVEGSLAALVNNAAVIPRERQVSADGVELQLAVNHLSHFLLTTLLLPALERRTPSRVVTVSSGSHFGPPFDFEDPGFRSRPYRRLEAYQQSKLANVLFTLGLARRLQGSSTQALAVQPGVYDTELYGDFVGRSWGRARIARAFVPGPERAGPMLADLAVGRQEADLNGAYFDASQRVSPSDAATDREAQDRLWAWSAHAVAPHLEGAPGARGGGPPPRL